MINLLLISFNLYKNSLINFKFKLNHFIFIILIIFNYYFLNDFILLIDNYFHYCYYY